MTIPPTPSLSDTQGANLPHGELQHAVTYLVMTRSLRWCSALYLGYGLCIGFLGFGYWFVQHVLRRAWKTGGFDYFTSAYLVLFPLALGLLVISLCNLLNPSRKYLLISSGTMFLSSLTIFLLFPLFAKVSPTGMSASQNLILLVLISLCLISLGVITIYGYWLMREPTGGRPSPMALQQAADLIKRVHATAWKNAPESLLFTMRYVGLLSGLLLEEYAVLATFSSLPSHAYFTSPAEFIIEPTGRTCFGCKWLKCSISINGEARPGAISPEGYARYQAWRERGLSAGL